MCLEVLSLLLKLTELGTAIVLPPDAGIEVGSVSHPTDVRNGQQTSGLINFLHGGSPVAYSTGKSTDVDKSESDVACTEEKGRPQSVETELNPVEREGLFGGVTSKTGGSTVKSLYGQVRSPTHGGVENGPDDTIVGRRGVERGLLEGFVPDRIGRVVGRFGGKSVDYTDGDGDTDGEDWVTGL